MSTTRAAAGHDDGDSSFPSSRRWSEIPDDLLSMVRLKISSPRDRFCMSAVCKPWRDAASRLPATPAVPVLILSPAGAIRTKHLCGPDGSWVMRVPSKAVNKRFVGSYQGGWIAAMDKHNRKLEILNLFSGAEVLLSDEKSAIDSLPGSWSSPYGAKIIKKIIFSDDPSSSGGCSLAALIIAPDGTPMISVCRVGCPAAGGWSAWHWNGDTTDIAFSNGELFGLTCFPRVLLARFEISVKEDGTPVITATPELAIQRSYDGFGYNSMENDGYIVELHGKTMVAVRRSWLPKHRPFFKVFELVDVIDDSQAYKHKWVEVTSFGDHALFLGRSKAVHLPDGERRHGIKRNHIYYYRPTRAGVA